MLSLLVSGLKFCVLLNRTPVLSFCHIRCNGSLHNETHEFYNLRFPLIFPTRLFLMFIIQGPSHDAQKFVNLKVIHPRCVLFKCYSTKQSYTTHIQPGKLVHVLCKTVFFLYSTRSLSSRYYCFSEFYLTENVFFINSFLHRNRFQQLSTTHFGLQPQIITPS